jgi:exodeoxyribonuclease V alpha subunit
MIRRPTPDPPPSAGPAVPPVGARRSAVPPEVAVLEPFVVAGVLEESEVHLAAAVTRLVPAVDPEVVLAVAVAARAPRLGHVCVVLDQVPGSVVLDGTGADPIGLPWPEPARWRRALESAPEVVGAPDPPMGTRRAPLVWDGERLYLQRYWSYEVAVADALVERARPCSDGAGPPADVVAAAIDARFGPAVDPGGHVDAQRRAVETALGSHLSVIAGGPGTGKTTTITALLQVVAAAASASATLPPRVALAAPTGKAAARMNEALGDVLETGVVAPATTIHRLLGWAPGTDFAHHAGDPLAADLVVVDETSMVDLSLMAHLLDAVRPGARLVLVGDPHQLASVEAGTVLGDVVTAASRSASPLAPFLTELTRQHRFAHGSAIASLAAGDARDGDAVRWVRADDPVAVDALERALAGHGVAVVEAARAGEGESALDAAGAAKLLAATRRGPFGLHAWSERIEAAVADRIDGPVDTLRRGERYYVGKPVLVTANDPIAGVANGDVGVVVVDPATGERRVAMRLEGAVRHLAPGRLDRIEPWWAMTIHKSQGSEFPEVVVSLPAAGSPILTRELLYTAVTRAKRSVTVIGSEEAIRDAVEHPVARASGLVGRLVGP